MLTLLGLLAGVLQLIGFGIYNWGIFTKKTNPNICTWSIWAFIVILNSSTYFAMSGDLAKNFLPIASAIANVLTWIFALTRKNKGSLSSNDWVILLLGIISAVVWAVYKDAAYANLIIQVALFISCIPLYKGVITKTHREEPLAWFFWSAAYAILCIVVFSSKSLRWEEIIFPVNCLIFHFGVGVIAKIINKKSERI